MGHLLDPARGAGAVLVLGRPVLVGDPLMSALTDLWPRTTAGMSVRWRDRVIANLHRHRDAFLTQIAHRQAGILPTPEEYPALRWESNGMFMFDVIESACGTEVPERLVRDQLSGQPEDMRTRIGHLTDVIAHIPGGHAAWLDTSARYRPPAA
ncbi:terpene synthase family protein [Saccharopolyspora sp. NPDC049426]|uniref:terpene synthase family protein n=1 Tax=Saccharopolyspora sp. NPDC049426 TaxID=3155652 RepID=UPI00344303A4